MTNYIKIEKFFLEKTTYGREEGAALVVRSPVGRRIW